MTDASQTDATADDDRFEPPSEAEMRAWRIEFRHEQRMEAQQDELRALAEEFGPLD